MGLLWSPLVFVLISMLRDFDEGDPCKALGEILVQLKFIPLENKHISLLYSEVKEEFENWV